MDPILVAGTGLVILGIVVWVVCVMAAYQQAPRRGRSAINWVVLTVIFGPLALFALFAMAPEAGWRPLSAASSRRASLLNAAPSRGVAAAERRRGRRLSTARAADARTSSGPRGGSQPVGNATAR